MHASILKNIKQRSSLTSKIFQYLKKKMQAVSPFRNVYGQYPKLDKSKSEVRNPEFNNILNEKSQNKQYPEWAKYQIGQNPE